MTGLKQTIATGFGIMGSADVGLQGPGLHTEPNHDVVMLPDC